MRKNLFRTEVFGVLLGLLAGGATAAFDVFILTHEEVPLGQLNADAIYPIFFQIFLYAFLANTQRLAVRPIFIGTTFFLAGNLLAYMGVFMASPWDRILPRFEAAFKGASLSTVLIDSSIARLTWSFFLMLLALALAGLKNRFRKRA